MDEQTPHRPQRLATDLENPRAMQGRLRTGPRDTHCDQNCQLRSALWRSSRLRQVFQFGVIILFLGSLSLCQAIIEEKELTMKDKIKFVEHFCFDDGIMNMHIKLHCPDCRFGTSLLICTKNEVERIQTDITDPCDGRDWGICEKRYFTDDYLNFTETVKNADLYFLMRSCQTSSRHVVSLSYTFMNGNDHLSCEHAASPLMYLCLTGLWLMTVLLWMWVVARNREQALTLHRMIVIVPLVQTFSMAVQSKYWENLNDIGEEREWMRLLWYMTTSLFKGLQFGVLMILAKGWCIVRPDMSLPDRRTMMLCVFWLIATTFTFQLLGGLFLFIWIVIYIVILRLLFSNIAYNHQMVLTQQSMYLAMNHIDAELRRLQVIAQMYKAFRVCVAAYLIAQVMFYVVQVFLLTPQTQWLFTATSQVADWLLCLWVGFLFRSRSLPPPDPQEAAAQAGAEELEPVRPNVVLIVNPSAATNKEELVVDGVAVGVRVGTVVAPLAVPEDTVVDVPPDVEDVPETIDISPVTEIPDAMEAGADAIEEQALPPDRAGWNVVAVGTPLDDVVQPIVAAPAAQGEGEQRTADGKGTYGIEAFVWPTMRRRHARPLVLSVTNSVDPVPPVAP